MRWLTPRRSVFVLILLAAAVVLGLAWVSVTSLKLESAQRESARQAEIVNKERRALWRLDSSMLTPLGLENNRPYAHYFALHTPTALVLNDSGDNNGDLVRVPSPLLSAEIPDWIAIHVQIDPERGWESPQVIPLHLQERLIADPLELSLTNCTVDRDRQLNRLRIQFPAGIVIASLIESERTEPEFDPYVVPVPLIDEPGTDKPMGAVGSIEPLARQKESPLPPEPPANATPAEKGAWSMAYSAGQCRVAVKGVDEASKKYSGLPAPALPYAPFGNTIPQQNTPSNQLAMKAAVQSQIQGSTRSVRANPDEATRDSEARKGVVSKAMESRGGYEVQSKNGMNSISNSANPSAAQQTNVVEQHQQGDIGGVVFGYRSENNSNNFTFGGLTSADRATLVYEATPSQLTFATVPGVLVAGTPNGDYFTIDNRVFSVRSGTVKQESLAFAVASRKPLVVQLHFPVTGSNKSGPAVVPVSVQLGPMKPHWIKGADGTDLLCLLRSARLESKTVYQGIVLDWPNLRAALKAQVEDLYPNAELEPIRNPEEAAAERTMTALPLLFIPNGDTPAISEQWSPLRTGLVIAWAAALLSIVAVGFGGRAILAMSERRVRFASAVTHELRTPLTAMQLHLDLLNSGLITDEAKKQEYLATIVAEADRLNRLVENVLAFAKLEKKSAQANARAVSVREILDSVRDTWADRLSREGFELVAETTAHDADAVRIDPRVLEQILGNLIDNARKYSQGAEDRRIWIRALPGEGRKLAIEVEDRGPGIPAAEVKSIFRPFQRGSSAHDTGGAGLGLSLAKEWVELFGGSIRCGSPTGGGCCFRIELPMA